MISFIHGGNESMASFRYRAAAPAAWLGASLNDAGADILVFSKPQEHELILAQNARADGSTVIVDFCDDHFGQWHYRKFLNLAHKVVCPTQAMAERIKALGRDATVIPEAYEFDEKPAHCNGDNLLWYGHGSNLKSFVKWCDDGIDIVDVMNLRIVSNTIGTIPWSLETMVREFALADFVLLPETASYKSPNRAVEAIRQGCFVVAEPHPALIDFPIWKGNIKEGIEWAKQNRQQANEMVTQAQNYVRERYSPRTVASAWRRLLTAKPSTSERVESSGTDGSQLIFTEPTPTYSATCVSWNFPPITPTPQPLSTSWSTSTNGRPETC